MGSRIKNFKKLTEQENKQFSSESADIHNVDARSHDDT